MIFKALKSPRQIFTFNGTLNHAIGGIFETSNTNLIAFLKKNSNFASIDDVKESEPTKDPTPVVDSEVEDTKKVIIKKKKKKK